MLFMRCLKWNLLVCICFSIFLTANILFIGGGENFSLLNVWHVVTFVRHNTFVNEMFPGSRCRVMIYYWISFFMELFSEVYFSKMYRADIHRANIFTRLYLWIVVRDIFACNWIFIEKLENLFFCRSVFLEYIFEEGIWNISNLRWNFLFL